MKRMCQMDEVGRKQLPHEPPWWVDPQKEMFFLTVCCAERRVNHLCHEQIARTIFAITGYYHDRAEWYVALLLLMPDHVHMLVHFPPAPGLSAVIRKWKAMVAKSAKIQWQRDFFDHRLRSDEGYLEKDAYIRANPVRAGLIEPGGDWPWIWERDPNG